MKDAAAKPTFRALGGLHEACFGVPDLDEAAAYWAAFGFRPDARGALTGRARSGTRRPVGAAPPSAI